MDVSLRPLETRDAPLLARLYAAQQAFLAPFDPPRPDSFYSLEGQRLELELLERERANDRLYRFLIEADGEPAGAISVSRITRGPFQNGGLGYWVAEELNGRGVATAAIGRACEWGFGTAGLHRLEAATLVDNIGSQTALRRNGFLEIGRSPNYLYINGAWRDHLLFARTIEDTRQ
ncbi:MAG TPA: GNAT family protein [Gaiellales bacterium]|jgi:ribosomal-protein-alanine N-acetyltransferase|nr:GNAT family protein [Gaiellales bacterium]